MAEGFIAPGGRPGSDQPAPAQATLAGVDQLLRSFGADDIPHPGGNLHAHLMRVGATLRDWGNDLDMQLAGACHAFYGTDGFDVALIDLDERATLVAAIGPRAESIVYQYASCDRTRTYPLLGVGSPVAFHDRFIGCAHGIDEPAVRSFIELTAANELDVLSQRPDMAAEFGPSLFELLRRCRTSLTREAWRACVEAFGEAASIASP